MTILPPLKGPGLYKWHRYPVLPHGLELGVRLVAMKWSTLLREHSLRGGPRVELPADYSGPTHERLVAASPRHHCIEER